MVILKYKQEYSMRVLMLHGSSFFTKTFQSKKGIILVKMNLELSPLFAHIRLFLFIVNIYSEFQIYVQ